MKARKRLYYYVLIAIILISIAVAWTIWITPALECSRCLGINVRKDAVIEVFEADYGTIYFLQISAVDLATISSRLSAYAVDKDPVRFIPELRYRDALGISSKCYRIDNYQNRFVCHIVLFSDSLNCVVEVIGK